jgi:two-component system invasion response regulator UvrY
VIRVLLADDHTIVRAGVKELLVETGDIAVTGEAGSGAEVLARVREGDYDVAVLDMSMPGRSGVELIKQLKKEQPKLRILILSMHSETQYAVRAIKAGASGYITKDGAADQLVAAIRRIAAGGAYMSPEAAELLARDYQRPADAPPHTLLSDREFQVLKLIVSGKSVTAIGEELSLSVKTVSTHKTRIMEKMGIANQVDLVRYAIRHGLMDESPDSEPGG